MSGDRALDARTATEPFDGAAVERLIVRLPERYQPLRILGHGGQGMVWLAEDRELGEQVAIKLLARMDDVAAERVRREVRVCRHLRHPNLAEIFELVEAGDTLAVVMEHLPGGSLADRLREGPLPVAEVTRVARELLAGLAHLHAAGIVHRDVKPSNVLFAADGAAKLADFGLLRPCESDDGLTRTGLAVGTPSYMSPEQIRGDEPAPPSDLYALGVTLFELLSGRRPFMATSALEIAHLHRSASPPDVRTLRPDSPRWLAAFVERLLAKDPGHRWPAAGAALAAFDRRRPGLTRRTRRLLAGAGVLGAATVGGVLAMQYLSGRSGLAVRVEGTTLVAMSTSGRELWRKDLSLLILHAVLGDVSPPPGPEVVTAEVTETDGICSTELVVRDRRGGELRRETAGHADAAFFFPGYTDSYAGRTPYRFDLDGDSFEDVIAPLNHSVFYPSMLHVWRPAGNRSGSTILANSGHIYDVGAADLDGDSGPEVVVTGVNNLLGYQNFVAVLQLRRAATTDFAGARSPDLMTPARGMGDDWAPLRAYTMLGETRGQALIESVGRDGITLRAGDRVIRLDAAANPAGSILDGRGFEPRRSFWADRADTGLLLARTPARTGELVDAFTARHAAVCTEADSRDAALISFARDLADAGRPDLGADLLERAERGDATNRRVWRQRGELLLLAGQHREARAYLERAATSAGRGSAPVDEMTMLALDAYARADAQAVDLVQRLWSNAANGSYWLYQAHLDSVKAFMDGHFQQARSRALRWDADAWSWQALAQWAALEDGAPAAQVLDALERIGARPEARDLCLVVRARADLLAGDPASAAERARQALQGMRGQARRAYEPFLWEGMAHWMLGTALNNAGDPAAARPHLEIAAARLPGTWMGRDARARLTGDIRTRGRA